MKNVKKSFAGLTILSFVVALSFGISSSNAQVGSCMFNQKDCCATQFGSTECAASGGCAGCQPQ